MEYNKDLRKFLLVSVKLVAKSPYTMKFASEVSSLPFQPYPFIQFMPSLF